MDSYIFSIWYELTYFCLPLNPAIHRMGNAPNILCPRCKEQEESQPYFIFYCKLSKITLRLHQWTNQSKIHFQYPFQNYSQNHHNALHHKAPGVNIPLYSNSWYVEESSSFSILYLNISKIGLSTNLVCHLDFIAVPFCLVTLTSPHLKNPT